MIESILKKKKTFKKTRQNKKTNIYVKQLLKK